MQKSSNPPTKGLPSATPATTERSEGWRRAAAPSTSGAALLVTADDRTGALEAGGACAEQGFAVRFAPAPAEDDDCALLDLASRHTTPREAARRASAAHAHAARFRCHKMDSALRGNWAHEVAALLAAGHRVGLLASFPNAGRRCDDGRVFVHDVPLLDTAFARDPRSRLFSDRPADCLRAAGCDDALRRGEVVVLNANDNAELATAAAQCHAEARMLVGTTGGIDAYVATLRPNVKRAMAPLPLPRPALVVCGSLHPLSREQVAALGCAKATLGETEPAVSALCAGTDVVLATPPETQVDDAAAEAMATRLAATTRDILRQSGAPTLIALGGDTAAAVLGEHELRVTGNVAVGVPTCEMDESHVAEWTAQLRRIVTKGGGIGEPDTLTRLLPQSEVL